MRTCTCLVVLVAVFSFLAGETAQAQAQPPLKGEALGKASQLVGTWFNTTENGDFPCMEFTKEGKALLGDGSVGLTVDYSVLDGGRLSLVAPGGATQVFDAKIAGDQLELSGAGSIFSSGGTQRFRRLAAGETCADAQKAKAKASAAAYQQRVIALQAFLKQPDLVLACTETGPGGPSAIALEVTATNDRFSGKAWHDDPSPHLDQISGQLQLEEAAHRAQLVVTFGQRIAPAATQPDGGGQIAMNVEGEGNGLRITSKVTFGNGGPAHEMSLKSDAKLHSEIVKRYEAELAAIEALKQPLLALLKDFAVLRGQVQSTDPRSSEPDTTELTLARDPKSGQYACEGIYVGPRARGELAAPAAAEIAIANRKPLLRIVTPTRQYLLELDDKETTRLVGQWGPPGGVGRRAQFEVVEAIDAGARDAKFEARRKAIKALAADSIFTGLAFEDSGFGMEMAIPFRLQLTVKPDGTVAGIGDYPTLETRMSVTGGLAESPFGPRLQLSYTAAEATPGNQIFLRSIQAGSWQLIPTEAAGSLQLVGCFSGPPVRTTTLTLVNADSTVRLRRHLTDVMGAGGRLYVSKFVGWQTPGVPPTVVEWKFDDATGKLTGRTVADGRALGTNEKMVPSFEGELKVENGWLVFEVWEVSPYHAYDRAVSALRLYVAEDARGVLQMSGALSSPPVVPNEKPLPPFPATLERLIGLMPVADTDAETHAAIDRAVAGAEKSKADADSATKATQTAALDARRSKMAPFFPMFQANRRLVITTDTPVELGSLILESAVDEPNATITGKGVDLREVPFREFTFESGIDHWGNLTVTTSLAKTAAAFAPPKGDVAAGRGVTLKLLSDADGAKLDAAVALGRRLQSAAPSVLTVEVLDPAAAKARETGLAATSMPGVAIYRNVKNDQVAAMFTAQSNGRYKWSKEPVTFRLSEVMTGKALYLRNGAATENLVVVVNGVHRATIPAIAPQGAAVITLPPDLELFDLRLMAEGTAQTRGVVLLK